MFVYVVEKENEFFFCWIGKLFFCLQLEEISSKYKNCSETAASHILCYIRTITSHHVYRLDILKTVY